MNKTVKIDDMVDEIMKGLEEYASLAGDTLKDAVKKAGDTAKKEVKENAPKRTGAYKKSWTVKKIKETSNSLELVVHSKSKYQLTHLLENGHATRNGGRTKAMPHIKPAEEKAVKQLQEDIVKGLNNLWMK